LISSPLTAIVQPQNFQAKGNYNPLKGNKKRLKRGLIIGLILLVGIPLAAGILIRMEGEAPQLEVILTTNAIGASKTLPVSVSDPKSGIRKVWVAIYKDGRETVLFDKEFPALGFAQGGQSHSESFDILIEPRRLGLSDGKALLRVMARDYSWRSLGHGNKTYLEKEILIDTVPPQIDVMSYMHNVSLGGAGLVIYRLSESCTVSGVAVGEHFYPGYAGPFEDKTVYLAFMALAYDQTPDTEMYVKAEDSAGNVSRKGFQYYIKKRAFKKDVIRLTDGFFKSKLPEFDHEIPARVGAALVDRFLFVNRDLRAQNYQTVSNLVQKTEPTIYWDKAFLRLPHAARQAGFAEQRKYQYNGKVIDQQVHLGIDLASTAHSEVPAANRGKVVFAGNLGIYGQAVVIDHGYGLFSMYAHLSSMAVAPGQVVDRGETIGRTGRTGMAGGDHLHFSMLIHNTFVNPLEWWDAAWIQNNITSKIERVNAGQ
jgi:murein DD-endopeptidase MepM/ murein hydrolase activator NlpD